MIKIHKDKLGVDGQITTIKGKIRKILTVQFQPRVGPCIWYEIDDSLKEVEVKIIATGTGWDLPKDLKWWDYVGTMQDELGFVWHYYATPFSNESLDEELGDLFGAFFGSKN